MQATDPKRDEPGRALTLWQLVDDEPVKSAATDALVLREGETAAWESSMPAQDPVLVPVAAEPRDGIDGVLAALVLPRGRDAAAEDAAAHTKLNGVRLQAGMHLLRHGSRIEVGDHMFWVSASAVPREELYDSAQHGEDLFCFRLKSRFEPGDALVVCPGVPDQVCGMMYSRRAWDLGLACHGCGWDPATPEWQPERSEWTAGHRSSAKERLFQLAVAWKSRSETFGQGVQA